MHQRMGGIRSPGAFRKTSDADPPTSGGAFSVWTPNTTSIRTYRNQIPNQSVVSVEKAGAFVVAGSSVSGGTWTAPAITMPAGKQQVTVSATKDGYTTPQTSTSQTSVNAVTTPVLTSPLVWNRRKIHALPERRRAARLCPAAGLPWPVLWFTVP